MLNAWILAGLDQDGGLNMISHCEIADFNGKFISLYNNVPFIFECFHDQPSYPTSTDADCNFMMKMHSQKIIQKQGGLW